MLDLKGLREKARLLQGEVAAELNVSQTAVSKWENGTNAINKKHKKALAKLYKVSERTIGIAIRSVRHE